jgi:5-methylcytosine-specific restriction endonuclease McrA
VRRRLKRREGFAENCHVESEFGVSRSAAAAAFSAFCEAKLSPTEAAALLLACAQSMGIPWDVPRKDVVWEALQYFCSRHVEPDELERYGAAISSRLAAGKPAVRPHLTAAVRWPVEQRFRKGRRRDRLPRDAEEFRDQQKALASARAKRAHVRNQQTQKYSELRNQALAAAGYRCERCGFSGPLELHHKHYASLGNERLTDVEMLCRKCHERETERQWAYRRARWRPWSAGRSTTWR